MSYEINKDQIIARLLSETGARSEKDLSRKIGMDESTVNGWKKKGLKINFEVLLETFGESLDWNYIMVGRRGGMLSVQLRKLEADIENLAKTLQIIEK